MDVPMALVLLKDLRRMGTPNQIRSAMLTYRFSNIPNEKPESLLRIGTPSPIPYAAPRADALMMIITHDVSIPLR